MPKFKYSAANLNGLQVNAKHALAMNHSMMLYSKNALYSFIPKNACSTLRLSTAIANGCIDNIEQGHWIHANNQTFKPTLSEAINIDYSFVVLRCPFRRLASVYLDKFVSKEPDAWLYRNAISRSMDLNEISFRDFVMSLQEPAILNLNIHWRPQVDFLVFEEYSDYFSFESLNQAITSLKNKIDFNVIDARELTNHGTQKFKSIDKHCFADMAAFDIAAMKRNGECPSHAALYDKELYDLVSQLYSKDISLYTDKCDAKALLKRREVSSFILDINKVTFSDIKYSFEIDFLRDEALKIEKSDLSLAFRLMSLAYQARPNGTFIKKKFESYKRELAAGESSSKCE